MQLRSIIKRIVKRFGSRKEVVTEIPLGEREGYDTVFDDDSMMVLVIRGRTDECIICFTGVGHQLGGIDMQNPEFARSDGEETKIFVIDKHRSWGNDIDWGRLKNIVNHLVPNAEITTLGNSMGGFLAILSASVFGAKQAIAFVPQWSIDPLIVPEEDRWKQYTQRIQKIHYPDLSDVVNAGGGEYMFFSMEAKKITFIKRNLKKRILNLLYCTTVCMMLPDI